MTLYSEYSGALLDSAQHVADPMQLQMRPDTPELDDATSIEEMNDAISVEEMNGHLFETARQESIRSRMEQIVDEELANPMDIDDVHNSRASTPVSRPVSLIRAEYNEYGVLTARSKGKGREN
jgi:hypothetical protein